MDEMELNEIEVASPSVVRTAARDFAAVLAETPQFKAFEQATLRFRQDEAAQKAMQAYQQKQQSLHMMLRLNAVSPQDKAALEQLQNEWLSHSSVAEYFQAQNELAALCQSLGDLLSGQIGLNYSTACGASCCG